MSLFSSWFGDGGERCEKCGAPAGAADDAGGGFSVRLSVPSWDDVGRLVPSEERLEDLRRLLDLRPAVGGDPVCREDPRTNQVECQMYPGRGFRPENVEVNVRGRQVELRAKQEDKSDDGQNYSLRVVHRTFQVPESADAERLTAHMESDGRFVLRAPLIKPTAAQISDGAVPLQINRK